MNLNAKTNVKYEDFAPIVWGCLNSSYRKAETINLLKSLFDRACEVKLTKNVTTARLKRVNMSALIDELKIGPVMSRTLKTNASVIGNFSRNVAIFCSEESAKAFFEEQYEILDADLKKVAAAYRQCRSAIPKDSIFDSMLKDNWIQSAIKQQKEASSKTDAWYDTAIICLAVLTVTLFACNFLMNSSWPIGGTTLSFAAFLFAAHERHLALI